MKKGKSRMRSRIDLMRSREANARRKARQQPRARYDRTKYDGHASEES